MWLITTVGFFSIVQKPTDRYGDTLTIRARVRQDLERLREEFLPSLGEITTSEDNDYRYRALAARSEVASAMAAMVDALEYGNFKSAVGAQQGSARASLYHDVWSELYRLQTQEQAFTTSGTRNPRTARKTRQLPLPVIDDDDDDVDHYVDVDVDIESHNDSAPTDPENKATPGRDQEGSESALTSVSANALRLGGLVAWHPLPDDHGRPVSIYHPSSPTPLHTWHESHTVACVTPCGEMPAEVNAIALEPWRDVPTTAKGWLQEAQVQMPDDTPMQAPPSYRQAAGVVIREPDGRYWAVAPTNAYGDYDITFPKGGVESGMTLQATALKEAFEESGLRVRLIGHLIDVPRSLSYTRYYLAERMGGTPADMGWESQAVILAPLDQLAMLLNSAYDLPLVKALRMLD